MTHYTVFTPTFNRARTLDRAYRSLLNQTFKDFIWLIIDDGSTDTTQELVRGWIAENGLVIRYHYQEHRGRHIAMRMAWRLVETDYLIMLDNDCELKAEAIEVFNKYWKQLEEQGCKDAFAGVIGNTEMADGAFLGNYHLPAATDYIDATWHEMVLKRRNHNEHIICWDSKKLLKFGDIPEPLWLSEKCNTVFSIIPWARVGRHFKNRYLNKILRIYHTDGGESILRSSNKTQGFYNVMVGSKHFLDENLDYFFWNPRYFISMVLRLISASMFLRFSPAQLLKEISSLKLKVFYLLFLPLGFLAHGHFRLTKKSWF